MNRFPVLVGLTIVVNAETPSAAIDGARVMFGAAQESGPREMFAPARLTAQVLDVSEMDNEQPLYPEYSRGMLEALYHQAGAAMRYAATVLAGPGATEQQVDDKVYWLATESQEMARKAEVIRRLRNTEGTHQ